MDQRNHHDHFRMPALLGPASGPRNMPFDRAHLRFDGDVTQLSITVEADPDKLQRILPERCVPAAKATVEMQYMRLDRLGWLAGRGYNVVALRIPVIFNGRGGPMSCGYMPILWEDMADPILTGREELGSPKLFADIADLRLAGGQWSGNASWDGFRFFEMTAQTPNIDDREPQRRPPTLLRRYHPRTGVWSQADIDQLTIGGPGEAPAPVVHERLRGHGEFAFYPARWEDMPTQYNFINTVVGLGIAGRGEATFMRSSGMMDLAAQQIID